MSDSWNDIQASKDRHNTMRAKMLERRKQLKGLVAELSSGAGAPPVVPATFQAAVTEPPAMPGMAKSLVKTTPIVTVLPAKQDSIPKDVKVSADPEVEKKLLMVLCDISLEIPSDSKVITEHTSRLMEREVDQLLVEGLLRKFAKQKLLSIKFTEGVEALVVNSLDLTQLSAMTKSHSRKRKRDSDDEEEEEIGSKQMKIVPGPETGDVESLLSMPSAKEREEKKLNEEIQALLVTQTAKEQYLVEKFKSKGGPQLQEFCQYGTREECQRTGPEGANCKRLHFKKIIHKHTDESLGDCSFLNTCFHMDICKDSSDMASNVAGTTHQLVHSGTVQQTPSTGWYYDYETNSTIDGLYTGHGHGPLSRQYPQVAVASTPITNSNILPGAYPPTPVPDTSHISGRSFAPVPAPLVVDPNGSYPSTGGIPADPNRSSNLNIVRELSARPFPVPSIPNTANDAHPSAGMPVSQQAVGPQNPRQVPTRPYNPVPATDANVVPSRLPPVMPSTSNFPYASIPYSLTALPQAPTACTVTSPPFTQVGDMSSYDMNATPVVSYSWSLTSDLFSNNVPQPEPKSSPKAAKPKTIYNSAKKRVRHPELWKKNLTKSKKLKGEEHVSRTGNVIPAKRVEKVDCSNCSFKCHTSFSEDLRQELFNVFYSLGSNESQKQFVCQNVQESATKVAGINKKDGAGENKRKVCRKYFLPDTDNTRKQVCSRFFCSTLAIGKTFITHALKNKQFGCYVGKEKRGKPHNKIPDLMLEPARQHINAMLTGSSSGSKKSSKKKCLERALNITKMHEMYKQECAEKNVIPVSLSMYRRIFHTEF